MLTSIVAAIAGAAAAALFDRVTFPRTVPVRTLLLVVGGAGLGFTAAVLLSLPGGSGPSLTVYSSFPRRNAHGGTNKRTEDMEKAIRFALHDHDRKAGKFTINYEPLDETDDTGAILPKNIQHNALIAAKDHKTAVYIGDFSSSASIESIPILSAEGVPQISPSSTRVGLTINDDLLSDMHEPDQYYPTGTRNFVRVIPNDQVQAAALGARMKSDHCSKVAIIYDGQDYSQGLSVLMKLIKRPPLHIFSEDVRPNERAKRYRWLAEKAADRGADCFLYMGADNPNTFGIFSAFAKELPDDAHLYGTDGVSESSLRDANDQFGNFVSRVSLMVPPRDYGANKYRQFQQRFANSPDPYAVYAYEAMNLALDAIKASRSGKQPDIRGQLLKHMKDRDSLLGTYSINTRGDTTLIDSDVLRFKPGGSPLLLERTVGPRALKASLKALQDQKK